ncbi:MAG: tRNA uridine-5-carboxymethylaminomethyl(34) synthesis enzyme MnmG, partial [Ignavibacteriae bacterium]|nr:tRNA uridine-5-carboxymethylaminomethyl(34) synthesis enzyme MnmG [Ignavibacteriota bacterium]
KQKVKISTIISRPQVSLNSFIENDKNQKFGLSNFSNECLEQAEIKIKYSGYIDRERETAKKLTRLEGIKLNPDFDYSKMNSISSEAREKLSKIKPESIGQASRISGVSPSDISVLLIHFGR